MLFDGDRVEASMTDTDFGEADGNVCYVREVYAKDVRDDLEQDFDADDAFEDDSILYALYDGEGARIALMSDREIAFAAARQHELTPLSVH